MATKAKHRIVIDTNLWISFLLTSDYSKIDPLFSSQGIVLLFSQELIDEFIEDLKLEVLQNEQTEKTDSDFTNAEDDLNNPTKI